MGNLWIYPRSHLSSVCGQAAQARASPDARAAAAVEIAALPAGDETTVAAYFFNIRSDNRFQNENDIYIYIYIYV